MRREEPLSKRQVLKLLIELVGLDKAKYEQAREHMMDFGTAEDLAGRVLVEAGDKVAPSDAQQFGRTARGAARDALLDFLTREWKGSDRVQ